MIERLGLAFALAALGPLASSPSPYLREAARSPIRWRPYGPAALAEARRLDRPLLVDIGAGWCHWCHVMDEGTYSRPEVAAAVAAHFIPVKIDRDLSPDLDAYFQRAAAALGGAGGWPLTLFLGPDGAPYFAVGYLPPDRLTTLLNGVAEAWRGLAKGAARRLGREALAEDEARLEGAGELSLAVAKQIGEGLRAELDPVHGGFGTEGPKFPNGPAVQLALDLADAAGGGPLLGVATTTLAGMARGGVRDHVGGGFHRYSVGPDWAVPHFEKLLPVNAALLSAYLDGWRATGDDLDREVASETVEWLLGPEVWDRRHGGFHASQDSDVGPGDDGSYFTWSLDALRAAGGEEAVTFFGAVALPEQLATEPQQNVLAEPILRLHPRPIIERLRIARARRRAPGIDDTRYAAWNGMAIEALLEAGAALDNPTATRAALQTLDLFLAHAAGQHAISAAGKPIGDPTLRRLDDLAQLGLACVSAFEATGAERYLSAARALVAQANRLLWDEGKGWYRESTSPLRAPAQILDLPSPAPNAAMALLLTRLSAVGGDVAEGQRADRILASFAGLASKAGSHAAVYGLALLERKGTALRVAIAGATGDGRAQSLRTAAFATYRPGKRIEGRGSAEAKPYPAGPRGAPRAYVCAARACAPPTGDPDQLRRLIQSWGR